MENDLIMIVDDNQELLNELEETLSLCGYDIKIVRESSSALKIARKVKPAAILLDMKMSGMNGFEVAQELKRSKDTAHIPVIAMSGYFPLERDSSLLDLSNFKGRIKKPFSILDLISQLEAALGKDVSAAEDVYL